MRHESVTDEWVAKLQSGFLAEAEWVKDATNWPETQRRMIVGTCPYVVAIKRVDEGWTLDEIVREYVTTIFTAT